MAGEADGLAAAVRLLGGLFPSGGSARTVTVGLDAEVFG